MIHQNRRSGLRRTLAAAGAIALALAGAVSLGSAAQAAEGPSPANIIGTTGTLTIHKHAGDPGSAGNGQAITDPTAIAALGQGLDGVVFSVQRVTNGGTPLDLTTDAGWQTAQSATVAKVQGGTDGFGLQAQTSVTTSGGGLATASNLPFGLYLVTETSPGPNPVVSPAQPFLVSVPYPNTSDSTWLYNVNVYPKNKLNTTVPTKSVSDPASPVLGSTVTWTITAPIPALGQGDTYRKFVVTDKLDPRLSLTGAVVKLDGTTLTLGSDYTLTPAPPAAGGPNVTVTLTGALANLAGKANVTVELTTTVDSLGADGKIVNTALVNVNDTTKQTNTPQTNWGALKVLKTAAQAPNHTLQGAEFEIYDAKNGTKLAGPLPTDANGELLVPGLWVGNGATLSKDYWLKETKAPTGYVLPTGDAAWTQVTVTAGSTAQATVKSITNTQQNGPRLPLTGSTGTALFVGGGAALLLAATGTALVLSRRRKAEAAE